MEKCHASNENYVSTRFERIRLTKHAKRRCQQRGGQETQIPLIKIFGEAQHDGYGAIRYTMTKTAMDAMHRGCGYNKTLDALEGKYIVVSTDNGDVITFAHLHH